MLFIQDNHINAPIKIPSYIVIEVYQDSISDNNFLGYHIMPTQGVEDFYTEIYNLIIDAIGSPGDEYQLAVLAGNNGNQYYYNLVYAVWYDGVAPTYPAPPTITPLPAPAEEYNVWETHIIRNNGNNTDAVITITANTGLVEFYINNDYYCVENNADDSIIKISKDGVTIDTEITDDYKVTNTPTLYSGDNTIKIKKTNIKDININYYLTY